MAAEYGSLELIKLLLGSEESQQQLQNVQAIRICLAACVAEQCCADAGRSGEISLLHRVSAGA